MWRVRAGSTSHHTLERRRQLLGVEYDMPWLLLGHLPVRPSSDHHAVLVPCVVTSAQRHTSQAHAAWSSLPQLTRCLPVDGPCSWQALPAP